MVFRSSNRLLSALTFMAPVLVFPATSAAQIPGAHMPMFTGTVKLACEAILCLSSGVQPSACSPALAHYFGISHRKWSDTLRGRLDFLSMCPTASDPGVAKRIPEITQGAGRCDANHLNTTNQRTAFRYKYDRYSLQDKYWDVQEFQAIANAKPSYCVTYTEHEWTYDLGTKYVGDPLNGGYWVTASQYNAALAKWAAQQANKNDGYTRSWNDPREFINSNSFNN